MAAPNHKITLQEFAKQAVGVPFVDRGRDWSGWDCWGLILMAYKSCFGLDLPYGSDFSCTQPREVIAAFSDGFQDWPEVLLGKELPGDIILTRPCHTGLVMERGKMLNCREGIGTVIERFNNSLWERAIIGIYRHAEFVTNR
jgi:probable lipoprotein NlpC